MSLRKFFLGMYHHKVEIGFLLMVGISLYIVFSRNNYNFQIKNLFNQKISEKELLNQFVGRSSSGKIYRLKNNRLSVFFPKEPTENAPQIIKNVLIAKISCQRNSVAFIMNNNLWILQDSSFTKRKQTEIEKWWNPNLRFTQKTKIKWSPDDNKIAFTLFDDNEINYLFVADVTNDKLYQLTDDMSFVLDFVWSSNADLCFSQLKENKQRIFIIDYDGGERQLLDQD